MRGIKRKYSATRCICIDVDGTLLVRGNLNRKLADWALAKKEEGFDVVLWSARGRSYCERIAKTFDITDNFSYIIGKPGFIVDDKDWSWIKYTHSLKRLD